MTLKRVMPAAAVLLLGTACGETYSSSMELEIAGTVNGVTIDEKGPYTNCRDDDGCRPYAYRNEAGTDAFMATPGFMPEDESSRFSARVVFANTAVRTGPSVGDTKFEFQQNDESGIGTGTVRMHTGVVVDRVYFTGDEIEPWKAEITLDFEEAALRYKGKVVIAPHCTEEVEDLPEVSAPCGDGDPDVEEANYYAELNIPVSIFGDSTLFPCPAEVLAVYHRQDGSLRGDAATNTVRIGDAEPLDCIRTGTGLFFCGATKDGVQAEGCTWKVDALYGLRGFQLGAKASNCDREIKHCAF